MSSILAPGTAPTLQRPHTEPLRAAFLGRPASLDACMPQTTTDLAPRRLECRDEDHEAIEAVQELAADAVVVLDPGAFSAEQLRAIGGLPGLTLGVLLDGLPADRDLPITAALDRAVSFDPSLTGASLDQATVWRAVPPPVADDLFASPRPLRGAPRAMAIGHSTDHRESMLMPSKHDHDLLQVVHGVSGHDLRELLSEYDVGVYVNPQDAPGFGWQVAAHLAAGQLLLAEPLVPSHGLERNIDYLSIDSPEGLASTLQRLRQFPEMPQRIRVRGRMKAEHFRASRLFARILHDLVADVAAFGRHPLRQSAVLV